MSRDILDLIDNAIWDTTGPDAMRWTPGAEKAGGEQCRCLLCMPQDEVRAAVAALDAHVLGPQIGAALAPPRTPVIDRARPGTQLVPFVGGPWANDLRAMQLPLPWCWNVAVPVAWDTSCLGDVSVDLPVSLAYILRRMRGHFTGGPGAPIRAWQVYTAPGFTRWDMKDALIVAAASGWRP